MKKFVLMVAILLTAGALRAQTDSQKTLYLIDGEIATLEMVQNLLPDNIRNMSVQKGFDTVVIVSTHEGDAKTNQSVGVATQRETMTIAIDNGVVNMQSSTQVGNTEVKADSSLNHALVLTVSANGTVTKQDGLSGFDPKDIKAISILKNDDAKAWSKYGDTSNGVIVVELKR